MLFLSLVKELTNKYYRKYIITEVAQALTDITEKNIIQIMPYHGVIDIENLIKKIKNTNYTIHEFLCYIQTIINMYSN